MSFQVEVREKESSMAKDLVANHRTARTSRWMLTVTH